MTAAGERVARTPLPRALPPEIEGAEAGGEVTVLAPDPDDGPASLDPAGLWSVTGNGIAQDLLFRSLTTFRQNDDGAYELVPDLATDLGTPKEDFTQWTFTQQAAQEDQPRRYRLVQGLAVGGDLPAADRRH